MKLINADKLMLSLADWKLQEEPIHTYERPKEFTADDMQRMIWRTIKDCESAVEEQPEVGAIPIDWILKWANKNCRYCLDYDYPTEKTDGWFDINNMVKDWGKENGLS